MNTKILFSRVTFVIMILIPYYSFAQYFSWAKAISGPAGGERGHAIATDASGNVYTTGYFYGTSDFDPGTGVFNLSSVAAEDAFISKFDSNGNFIWAKAIGGTNFQIPLAIILDASNNVYTTGYFNGTADFDPGTGIYNLTTTGNEDIFISKLDSAGNFIWAKKMGSTNSDYAESIATDALGNVYTTGSFVGTVDFNPNAGVYNLTSFGLNDDIFISKLDSTGNFVWAKKMGSTQIDSGSSIALDTMGNVYTTGIFIGTVDFNPGAGTFNLTSPNTNWTSFISKLDSAGNFVWAKKMGGTSETVSNSLSIDNYGNIYIGGSYFGSNDFNPGAGISILVSNGSRDIFITKLDTSGNFIWAKSMGGTNIDSPITITNDATGNVYSIGYFNTSADFDPDTSSFNLTSIGSDDIFVLKLNSSGNLIWVKQMGSTYTDIGFGLALDASGNIYSTGYFGQTIDFDPGFGVFNLTSLGPTDIFIHKMGLSPLTVGIKGNTDSLNNVVIYPNPSNGYISLKSKTKLGLISIYTALGSNIYEAFIANPETEIDLSHQPAGIYFIRLGSFITKIIKH